MGIYAPNDATARKAFFVECSQHFNDNMVLLGDFNTVTSEDDRLSGNLDPTSNFISQLLSLSSLCEVRGAHHFCFTYHYPSNPKRKSHIDKIYTNMDLGGIRGYNQHVSFSDHYLVGTYYLPTEDMCPQQWHMPLDCLSKQEIILYCELLLDNFDYAHPATCWEQLKIKLQTGIQSLTKFRIQQVKAELKGLKSMLKYLNKRIFHGDDLDMERKNIEAKIENTRDKIWFTSNSNDHDIEWLLNEGMMVKSFLHLEDIQGSPGIKELFDSSQTACNSQEILPVIHDFYQRLYAQNDLKTVDQVEHLLQSLDLPMVSQDTTVLVQPISAKEIANAIDKLKVGKAPGIDGITADFYKHFSDQLCEILVAVFNQFF